MLKRIVGWREKLLSYNSRLVLIKSCLAFLYTFYPLSNFLSGKLGWLNFKCPTVCGMVKNADRYHLAWWKHVTMKKEYGGLGIPDLRELNLCLLWYWIRRYSTDGDKIWKQLVDFKYKTNNPNILHCKDTWASNFFAGGYVGYKGCENRL
jgi:hypothetical protein